MRLPAERAACRDHDPNLWFPASLKAGGRDTQTALAVCFGCPIKRACLDYALTLEPRAVGIWGGRWFGNGEAKSMTPAERAACRHMARKGANAATIARTLAVPFKRVEMALRPDNDRP